MTFFYNLILFFFDGIVLHRAWRKQSLLIWLVSFFAVMVVGTCLAGVISGNNFYFLRLTAYCLFLHGAVISIGSTVIWLRIKRKFAIFSALIFLMLAALSCYVFMIEPYWLEVSHWEIISHKIQRPLRIAVVADLQTDDFGKYERDVLRRVLAEEPDVILLAGDYVQSSEDARMQIYRQINAYLHRIVFSAPRGIFAVQGNTDLPGWRELFRGINVHAVTTHRTFTVDNVRLTCLGLMESASTSLKVIGSHDKRFHIVLGHLPNFALGQIEADLLIAGHTHGGQVRIPLIGALMNNCQVPLAWTSGLTDLPSGGKLIVSRGIGMERGYAPRMRFCCRPELMIIDLKPENNND
ncbi:MAG: metallophosphoesterase [Thermoguttaceae bacterium]